ncbi:electron transfer flavoprotein subunit beta/FixA family protein [Photobacterium minamisatsumaniensis]|uniref:electron transfer flavoprotein subunit beta/FixA family protein n=1 Tax=Photobacterium minamisatsumaniensis TaxID=2910233 RepID=UPI003D097D06
MKVLVAVKRVIDPYVKVRVKSDGSGVEKSNVKMAMNPFCEIAVEEAVRLKEAGHADEVVVVSIGDSSCHEQLRTALALGADKAIHIEGDSELEPLMVAKLLNALVEKEQPKLVMLGKQSIDSDNNQVPQMLSALMHCSLATFASSIGIDSDVVTVTKEVDGGLETIALSFPAVISTDLRLNEPRYASLPNIMKAKKKPLDVIPLIDLGVNLRAHQQVLSVMPPPVREAGIQVNSVSELVDKLRNQAKVIE